MIGRNGEILKLEDNFGGTHRFALCKILKIKNIIVSVKSVHKAILKKSDIERTISKNDKLHLIKILKKKINYWCKVVKFFFNISGLKYCYSKY